LTAALFQLALKTG